VEVMNLNKKIIKKNERMQAKLEEYSNKKLKYKE
jgi:hypothetical protein